jgi:hypothetical protein
LEQVSLLTVALGQKGRDPPPAEEGSSLGLIVGVVVGVVAIGVGIAVALYIGKLRSREKVVEEDPMARVKQFYSDNRKETEAEFEMAFENPVFDTDQLLLADEFEVNADEQL